MHIFLLFCLFGANSPPLDDAEATRLSFVIDGRDSLDEGFSVLVENARSWEKVGAGQQSILNTAALAEIVENPTAYRGVLMRISGVVELPTRVDPPWDDVQEWFVRDATGSLFVLYVVGSFDVTSSTKVSANARFYKTIDLRGRDGKVRSFATFVTSGEGIERPQFMSEIPGLLFFIPLFVIGGVLVFLLGRKKKSNSPRLQERACQVEDVMHAAQDVATELPDDPAQALALLHESAEELT